MRLKIYTLSLMFGFLASSFVFASQHCDNGCLSPRLKSSSSVSSAFAVIDPVAPADASELEAQPEVRQVFLTGKRDTTLRKIFVKQTAVIRDLKNSIEGGMAVALPLGMENELLEQTLANIFNFSPEELASILQTGLHYDDDQGNAYRKLVEYLKIPGNTQDLKNRFQVALKSISLSPATLHSRELVVLIDDNYDMFSMGFCLVHMGRFKQRDSIYIHKNILEPDSSPFVRQILEYADRCLESGVMLNDIDNFSRLRKWWSGFMKKRFEHKIDDLVKTHRQTGLMLAADIKGRLRSSESFSSFMGIWNEFRALEYLTNAGYTVKRAGTQVGSSERGGFNVRPSHVLLEYDGLLSNENNEGVIIETKSWYFSVDDAKAHIVEALVGSPLQFDARGDMKRRRGKMQRFYDLALGLSKGHKYAGVPEDFNFKELLFVIADEEMRPVIENILKTDFDVQVWVGKFAELGIDVKFYFMSDSFQLNTTAPPIDAGFLGSGGMAPSNIHEVTGSKGQILLGRSGACFDALEREVKRKSFAVRDNLPLIARHVAQGAWFRLASLDYFIERRNISMGSVSFQTKIQGFDAIVKVVPLATELFAKVFVLSQGLSDEFETFKHKAAGLCSVHKQSKRKLKKTLKSLQELFNTQIGKKRLKSDSGLLPEDRRRLKQIRDICSAGKSPLESIRMGVCFVNAASPAYMQNGNRAAYSAEKLDRELDFLRAYFYSKDGSRALQSLDEVDIVVSIGANVELEQRVHEFVDELNARLYTKFHAVIFEKQLDHQSWVLPQTTQEFNSSFALLVSKFQNSKVLEIVENHAYRSYFRMLLKKRVLVNLVQKGALVIGEDLGFSLSADTYYLTDALFQLPGRGGLSLLKTCPSARYWNIEDFIENEIIYEITRFEQRKDLINRRIRHKFPKLQHTGVESLTYAVDVAGHTDWIPELLHLETSLRERFGVNIDIILVRSSEYDFDILDEQDSVEIIGKSLFPVSDEHRLLFEAA